MKKSLLKYGGIAAIIAGAAALYVSGTNEATVVEIVAGVFLLAGLIAQVIKDKLSD